MLDELVGVIDILKDRIDKHRAALQGNETQTRMSLIDPLLRALGWDTADPALVRPEYVVSGRRADYALLNAQGDVIVFLEAKNLGEQLANHRSQIVAYASELGIRFPALTNGNDWEVYDNSQLVPIGQRRVLNVSIADNDSAKCALQLLLLWRPNLASGQPVGASEPILGTEPELPTVLQISEPQSGIPTTAAPAQPTIQPTPSAPDGGWITLKDLDPESSEQPPQKLRLPSGDEKPIKYWRHLLIEVAEWLIDEKALTPDKCPITVGRRPGFCTINREPKHLNGNGFNGKYKYLSNGIYLDVNFDAPHHVSHSIAITEHLGKDPATVYVQVS